MKQISRFAKSVCSGCLPAAVLMLLSCTAAAAAPAKLEIPSTLDFGIVPPGIRQHQDVFHQESIGCR